MELVSKRRKKLIRVGGGIVKEELPKSDSEHDLVVNLSLPTPT